MSGTSFRNVGGHGTRRLRHLVVLTTAGVVFAVKVSHTELLRGKLYHIR
jgi:hypothetical protein